MTYQSISSMGMITSLGYSEQALASYRVGFNRSAELDLVFSVNDAVEPQPLIGYPVKEVKGLSAYSRLAYLVILALDDLLSKKKSNYLDSNNVGLVIAIPNTDERPLLESLELELGISSTALFKNALLSMCKHSHSFQHIRIINADHAGALVTLSEAQRLLTEGIVDQCIVGGVDSYMDSSSQEWLFSTSQLKSPTNSDGAIPGEGAALFILDNGSDGASLAKIDHFFMQRKDHSFIDEAYEPQQDTFAQLVGKVHDAAYIENEKISWVINDFNGHSIRAKEWGNTLVRCRHRFPQDDKYGEWTHVTSFGDVGVASLFYSIALFIHAKVRGYQPSNKALVTASSFSGCRAALSIY